MPSRSAEKAIDYSTRAADHAKLGRLRQDVRRQALLAHATQLTVGPTGKALALSNNLALPIVAQEHYILAAGDAGERDERGWETDLLAGVDLAAPVTR